MEFLNVRDAAFRQYGQVMEGYDLGEICRTMEEMPCPEDVIYEPSVAALEELEIAETLRQEGFGGLDIQIGYCNGRNKKLNALEYHRNSEINIAVTDLVLLLGRQQDIQADGTYHTSQVEAFFVPAGTMIEVYATTLHYAPCNTEEDGFRCVVVLPKGTNTEIDFPLPKTGEAARMTAKNKWLLAHEEAGIPGIVPMLRGENLSI